MIIHFVIQILRTISLCTHILDILKVGHNVWRVNFNLFSMPMPWILKNFQCHCYTIGALYQKLPRTKGGSLEFDGLKTSDIHGARSWRISPQFRRLWRSACVKEHIFSSQNSMVCNPSHYRSVDLHLFLDKIEPLLFYLQFKRKCKYGYNKIKKVTQKNEDSNHMVEQEN